MTFYKNVSHSVKTFYGVEFLPGDVKSVPGIINDKYMIISAPIKEIVKQQKLSPADLSKMAEKKPEVKKEDKHEDKPVQKPEVPQPEPATTDSEE